MADIIFWDSERCGGRTDLQTPSDYIDSKKYFSWERYFTELLTEKTSRTYLNYTKKTLNEAYLNDGTKNAILRQMGKLKID